MKRLHVLVSLALLMCAPAWSQGMSELQAIASLDVPRYMGTWYEIAKFPNRFQTQCVSDTTATYSALPDGHLKVVNQCRLKSGEMQQAVGAARQMGGPTSARLKVRFAPQWLSFLPFVWGDYWVVDLDNGYQVAVISEPSRQYLWILSRSPRMDDSRYADLVTKLAVMGFDTGKLEKTVHNKKGQSLP